MDAVESKESGLWGKKGMGRGSRGWVPGEEGRCGLRWEEKSSPWYGQHALDGCLGLRVPAEGICPRDSDVVDLDAAGFGEAEADVVPVVAKDDCRLLCWDESKDMAFSPFIDLFFGELQIMR